MNYTVGRDVPKACASRPERGAASKRWEFILKSASRAGDMPTDHLPKHGTSASWQTLYLSFSRGEQLNIYGELGVFTGMSDNFRGAARYYGEVKSVSEYFRASLNIFGAQFKTYAELSTFPGSVENLRARHFNLRGRSHYFGEQKNY